GAGGRAPGGCARAFPPLRGDELVQPADLTLDRFQAVPVELERVAVEPLPGPRHRRPDAVEPLLQPGPPAFQDPQPDVGPGLAEEREVHAEPIVIPGRWARFGQQILPPLLAVGGQLVDDLRAPAGALPGLAGVPGRTGVPGLAAVPGLAGALPGLAGVHCLAARPGRAGRPGIGR